MRKFLTSLFVFFLAFTVIAPLTLSAESPSGEAYDFNLEGLDKTSHSLRDYKGKPVLLLFWTTWCPFCRKELAELKNLSLGLEAEGFKVFAVDIQEAPYKVENFVQSHNLKVSVLLDKDAQAANAYGVLGVPTYVLINRHGQVVFKNHYFPKNTYRNLVSE